jgi:hypothetical protein
MKKLKKVSCHFCGKNFHPQGISKHEFSCSTKQEKPKPINVVYPVTSNTTIPIDEVKKVNQAYWDGKTEAENETKIVEKTYHRLIGFLLDSAMREKY